MKPADPDPAELLLRVRQQLILAQVRIMELEDARDAAGARAAEFDALTTAAQQLADRKLEEAAHLEQTRADLQTQFEHLRHVQHVTNEALEATRRDLALANQSVAQEKLISAGLGTQLQQCQSALAELQGRLQAVETESAARQDRIAVLTAELNADVSSRSWRWTAWLRALGRIGI